MNKAPQKNYDWISIPPITCLFIVKLHRNSCYHLPVKRRGNLFRQAILVSNIQRQKGILHAVAPCCTYLDEFYCRSRCILLALEILENLVSVSTPSPFILLVLWPVSLVGINCLIRFLHWLSEICEAKISSMPLPCIMYTVNTVPMSLARIYSGEQQGDFGITLSGCAEFYAELL